MKTITFVLTRPAYGSGLNSDAVDAILATSIFDQKINIIFTLDGVYQLSPLQQTDEILIKDYRKGFKALSIYGIENIYVDQESALARGIDKEKCAIDSQWITADEIQNIFTESDHILSF